MDYWNLNVLSDVYLDTPTWSGGRSTLEAVACNLPIVTIPGEFMRSRHSAAILRQLGVTETIAGNENEYVQIAARLALDRDWRKSVVARMQSGFGRLFNDRSCVAALEAFFQNAVERHWNCHGDSASHVDMAIQN